MCVAVPKVEAKAKQSKADVQLVPPEPIEGVADDVQDMELHDITRKDEVYNVELNWLAFNWRVLHMASEVR